VLGVAPTPNVVPSNCNPDPVANALVDDAYTTPLVVNAELEPVPPLVAGNVPETCVVRLILPVNPDVGNPVQLVSVPDDGVPKTPFTNTTPPELPVLMARAVATPVPKPDTPVVIGKPVQLVKMPLAGVPSAGVVSVGDVSVKPATVVVVVPSVRAVDPSVIAVAKLLSNCESGIADVAEPNVYGTAILEPHS